MSSLVWLKYRWLCVRLWMDRWGTSFEDIKWDLRVLKQTLGFVALPFFKVLEYRTSYTLIKGHPFTLPSQLLPETPFLNLWSSANHFFLLSCLHSTHFSQYHIWRVVFFRVLVRSVPSIEPFVGLNSLVLYIFISIFLPLNPRLTIFG